METYIIRQRLVDVHGFIHWIDIYQGQNESLAWDKFYEIDSNIALIHTSESLLSEKKKG